jgi:CubicO group peptidase (beta-lactamase class C family)
MGKTVVGLMVGMGLLCSAALAQPEPTPHLHATAAAAPDQSKHVLSSADLEAWLDGLMPYGLRTGDVAGGVVVVVKDGNVLFEKGYGYADVAARRSVDPQTTLFRPGSISKLFTWTAVMQLVEQHRIDLDRDINTYLDFKIPPFEGQPITMRDLMTHTAGFQDSLKDLISADQSTPPLGDFLKQQIPARIFPQGKIPAYSNYGAALAGYIVQRVSGQPFADYIEQHIFAPLDMRHSTFHQPLPGALKPFMSRGYLLGSGPPYPFEMFGALPAGGSTVSGADMAKFMIAHLQNGEYEGRRILQPDTARMMHDTALTTINPVLDRMELGFFEANRNGQRIIGHDGDTRLFHSALRLFLNSDVGIFVSLNSVGRDGATYAIRTALLDGFADRYFPGPSLRGHVSIAVAKTHGALLAGQYDGSRREDTSFASLANLFSQTSVTVDGNGHVVASSVTGLNGEPKTFEEIAPFVWRDVGGKELLAAKVAAGKVVMWAAGEDAPALVYTPTPAWRNGLWLIPLLFISIAALLLTVVAWPIVAIVRRRYGAAFPLQGTAALSYRWVRIASAASCFVMIAWLVMFGAILSTFYIVWAPFFISSRMMPWILLLHVLSIIVFLPAALIALWNVWVTFANQNGRRAVFARLWSVVLAVSCLTLLWVGLVFRLIGLGLAF